MPGKRSVPILLAAAARSLNAQQNVETAANEAKHVLEGSIYALGATAVFLFLLFAVTRANRFARKHILEWSVANRHLRRVYESGVLSSRRVAAALLTATGVFRWFIVLVLLQAYVTLVFSFFPGTAGLAARFSSLILAPLTVLWSEFVNYLPSLFFVIVISIGTFYILKLNRFLFLELRDGKIAIEGFYPDWAEPTSRLAGIAIFVLAAVVVFPYLPGSSSPAFKGISILVGILLSFGSGSATANVISGAILTYMRPYQLGDRVKIDETVGDVLEKSLLVTRIRIIKNVVVTIPNSSVLGSHILNYSTSARDAALIVHTTVTIGYSAPWRMVHELLIHAALGTPGVLAEPRPFVFQTALNDFFVSYQINAYTSDANHIDDIASAPHENIQDRFNEAGIEIMSPHNITLRDGNPISIPESYHPSGYRPPAFRGDVDGAKRADR